MYIEIREVPIQPAKSAYPACKIENIKLFRLATGAGLIEGKECIEEIIDNGVLKIQPDTFTAFDFDLMFANLKRDGFKPKMINTLSATQEELVRVIKNAIDRNEFDMAIDLLNILKG